MQRDAEDVRHLPRHSVPPGQDAKGWERDISQSNSHSEGTCVGSIFTSRVKVFFVNLPIPR